MIYDVSENPEFSDNMNKIEEGADATAELFNMPIVKLLENTRHTKKLIENTKASLDAYYQQLTDYTDQKIADLIDDAPETLNTLKELANAINANESIVDTLNNAIGLKANQSELDTHTGNSTIHITSTERIKWNAKSDTDTTYGVVSTTTNGLVPKRGGTTTKFFRDDGTWAVPPDTNTTYNIMNGASSSVAGSSGLVPAPAAGKQSAFLRGDGTWQGLITGFSTNSSILPAAAQACYALNERYKVLGYADTASTPDLTNGTATMTKLLKVGRVVQFDVAFRIDSTQNAGSEIQLFYLVTGYRPVVETSIAMNLFAPNTSYPSGSYTAELRIGTNGLVSVWLPNTGTISAYSAFKAHVVFVTAS